MAEHGRVLEGIDRDPFVTIEAGNVQYANYQAPVRYVVDRATQTCWLIVTGESLSAMDCCAARRVEAVARITTWATDQTCGTSGSMRPSTP